jgi:peptidoglycan/xylan/chitin deacetylase (PgdA/CDA1 family)
VKNWSSWIINEHAGVGQAALPSPNMMPSLSARTVLSDHALPYLCRYLGVNAALRAAQQKQLLVLSYHGVVSDGHYDPVHSDYTVSVSDFRQQMEILARYFRPITVSDLEDWWRGKAVLPRHSVLVTFDDGYRNNLINAAPVLLHFGVPALIHICTGYINQERILWMLDIHRRVLHWPKDTIPVPGSEIEKRLDDPRQRVPLASWVRQACKRLPHEECERYLNRLRETEIPESDAHDEEVFRFLSWDEVRTLQSKGFEIGSHTREHPILTRIPGTRADQELRASKLTIEEQTGSECRCFAYPNGGEEEVSKAITERVGQAGYRFAFTTMGQFCSRNESPFELGRISIPGNLSPTAFHNRISGFHDLLKRYMRGNSYFPSI